MARRHCCMPRYFKSMLLSVYYNHAPILLALSLFISNSTPRHLVCLHMDRNQWCGKYRTDQQVFTILVTLTLNTASQSFHDRHWFMMIHRNIKFGCKRISSFEDIVEAIFRLYEPCDLDLDDSKTSSFCLTLWLMMINHHTKFG